MAASVHVTEILSSDLHEPVVSVNHILLARRFAQYIDLQDWDHNIISKLLCGLCNGISPLWSYYFMRGEEEQFYATIRNFVALNGIGLQNLATSANPEVVAQRKQIEKFMQRILWLAARGRLLPISYSYYRDVIADAEEKFNFLGRFSREELVALLNQVVQSNHLIWICTNRHVISVACRDDGFYVYDSNCAAGARKFSAINDESIEYIFSCLRADDELMAEVVCMLHEEMVHEESAHDAEYTFPDVKFLTQRMILSRARDDSDEEIAKARREYILQTDASGNNLLYEMLRCEIPQLLEFFCECPEVQEMLKSGWFLIGAVMDGNIETATVLLNHGVLLDTINGNLMRTALGYAVINNNLAMARLLLGHKASPNVRYFHGYTALMDAAEIGNPEMVELLLEYGANPELFNCRSVTAAMLAEINGHHEIAVRLGLDDDFIPSPIDSCPDFHARANLAQEMIQSWTSELLALGAVAEAEASLPESKHAFGFSGRITVDEHLAILNQIIVPNAITVVGNEFYQLAIVKKDARFYVYNPYSARPLNSFVTLDADMVSWLHRNLGYPNTSVINIDCWHMGMLEDSAHLYPDPVELTKEIVQNRIRQEYPQAEEGDAALFAQEMATYIIKSCTGFCLRLIKLCISHDRVDLLQFYGEYFNLHRNLATGEFPLQWAIEAGAKECTAFLIESQRHFGMGKEGYTPLMRAVMAGQLEIVTALAQEKEYLDCQNLYGNTALILAAKLNRPEMIRVLLTAGSNAQLTNIFGLTARAFAEQKGFAEIFDRELGAITSAFRRSPCAFFTASISGISDVPRGNCGPICLPPQI